MRGVPYVDLTWSGVTTYFVDIYRNGGLMEEEWPNETMPYTDSTVQKRGGPYLYQVCEANTAVCSEVVTVTP